MTKFQIETPLKRARGFGSGKTGTGHFWQQRVTGVAALLLSLVYVVLLVKLQGDDYAAVMATLGNPFVAVLMLAAAGLWRRHDMEPAPVDDVLILGYAAIAYVMGWRLAMLWTDLRHPNRTDT